MKRRDVILSLSAGMTVFLAAPGAAYAEAAKITVEDAHSAAQKNELYLVDVRTRWEWAQTGIGEGAHAISMHEPNFLTKLEKLTNGDKTKPIALICATGVRSNSMQQILQRVGYETVIDVAEGMQGSSFGPGWLKKNLPVKEVKL